MKAFLISTILIFLLIVSLSSTQKISVNVGEVLRAEVSDIEYNSSVDGIFKIRFQLYNSGSTGYKARARLDVFNDSELVFTGWSEEKSFIPGTRETFSLYWLPPQKGRFLAKLRVYYADEIEKIRTIRVEVKNVSSLLKNFEITDLKTYSDEIKFKLKSNKSLKNVLIIPSDYPLGWVFEQKRIEKIDKDEIKDITLGYKPSLWKPSGITLKIVTEDGKYASSEHFSLKRVSPIEEFFHQFFKLLLSIIL